LRKSARGLREIILCEDTGIVEPISSADNNTKLGSGSVRLWRFNVYASALAFKLIRHPEVAPRSSRPRRYSKDGDIFPLKQLFSLRGP
jgi:hypothetical protein